MSGPPVKRVDDAPVRDDSERRFAYFTPAKRKASQYEDVTIDTQPSIHRHWKRPWPLYFADGRGTWDDGSTALRCGDWYAYRDPGQIWERPYYRNGAGTEAQIEAAVKGAVREGLFADFSEDWVAFLRANLQVPAFAEHGLWLATASIGRDCLSDSLTRCVVLQAAMKQRFAQALTLYAIDLEPHFGAFDLDEAKTRWLEHEAWQPTRDYVERLHATNDWAEVIVAANVCFEPLVGALIRRELGIRAATVNGDTVTPVLARGAQVEWGWMEDWTGALLALVLGDEEHGDANRETIAGWLAKWMPLAEQAADALPALVDEMPVGFDIEAGRARLLRDAAAFYERAGLNELLGARAA